MNEILINKPIGQDFWGDGEEISADSLRKSLGKIDETETKIRLTIDSPGGDVFEGITIFNIIRDFARNRPDCEIETYIQGVAASMASVIALAAASVSARNKIVVESNSAFMIHKAWGIVAGNSDDMRDAADWFDRIDGILCETYAKKTGRSEKEIRKMMGAETWLFGKEILDNGFCDSVLDSESAVEKTAALSYAKASVTNIQDFMKKKTVEAKKRFDYKAAARALNLPAKKDETTEKAVVQNTVSAGDGEGKNKMEGSMEITVENLKKENPEIFAQILEEGKRQGLEAEKARAERLLKMGEKAGCKDFALECIANGADPMDAEVVDAFFDKSVLRNRIQDKIEDEKEIPALNNLPKENLDDSEEVINGFASAIGGR